MRAALFAALIALFASSATAQDDLALPPEFDAFDTPQEVSLVPVVSYQRPNGGETTLGFMIAFETPFRRRANYGFETFFARDFTCAIVDAAVLGFGCNRAGSLNSYYVEQLFADRNDTVQPYAILGLAYGDASSRPRKDGSKFGAQAGLGVIVTIEAFSVDAKARFNTIDGYEQEFISTFRQFLSHSSDGDGELYLEVLGRSTIETESIGIGFHFKG